MKNAVSFEIFHPFSYAGSSLADSCSIAIKLDVTYLAGLMGSCVAVGPPWVKCIVQLVAFQTFDDDSIPHLVVKEVWTLLSTCEDASEKASRPTLNEVKV
jgi:hypothetical protein